MDAENGYRVYQCQASKPEARRNVPFAEDTGVPVRRPKSR